jgi:hypothetical protein
MIFQFEGKSAGRVGRGGGGFQRDPFNTVRD